MQDKIKKQYNQLLEELELHYDCLHHRHQPGARS